MIEFQFFGYIVDRTAVKDICHSTITEFLPLATPALRAGVSLERSKGGTTTVRYSRISKQLRFRAGAKRIPVCGTQATSGARKGGNVL